MKIREFNGSKSDILGIVKLINQFDQLPIPITLQDIELSVTQIDKTTSSIFIAEDVVEIIGYAFVTEVVFIGFGKYIELQQILVDEKHRNKGIGKQLLKECEKWAVENGYEKIMLSSRVHLTNAHSFYQGMGYTIARQSYFYQKDLKP